MMRMIAITAAAALAAVLLGLWLATEFMAPEDQFAACRNTSVAGGTSQIGGAFELIDSTGKTVTDQEVLAVPSLIYFGYTFCPDVCPLDTARNAEAVDVLEERGYMVTPVFISIDPQRDTPEVVGAFAANLHERMIGLTGTPEQVQAASRAYKTYYKAQEGDEDYYLVDHSTFSYLVLPGHGFVEFYRRDMSADALAESISCFLDNA